MSRSSRSALSCALLSVFVLGSLAGCAGGNSGGGSGGGNGGGTGGGGGTTPTPTITLLTPAKLNAGAAATTLTVTGTGFVAGSTVAVGGAAEATTYVSATSLTAAVPATQLANGAELAVTVSNSGTISLPSQLEVDNLSPVLTSASVTTETVDTASAVITFAGTGFDASTAIDVNGSSRTTTFINATQVSAALPSSDFLAAGSLSITAVNPAPGGGTSTALTLSVVNPPVGPIQLSPSTLFVGATSPATITVTGTGFVPSSVVSLAGSARATTFTDATTLTFTATVADQATAGTLAVTVSNAAPGGGTSPAAYLSIQVPPPTPVITSISPNTLLVGSGPASIAITGTGLTQNTIAQWNGVNLVTTYSYYYNPGGFSIELIATVPESDLALAGTANVTATTPNATPAVSNTLTVSITNPPVPTLTNLYPNGGPLNTASAVNLTGTGFTGNTSVLINGVTIPSTFVSSTQITSTFPASSLALPGNQNVTVSTPAPGGGVSAAQVFTTYIPTAVNDLLWNAVDGLLYASIPATAAGGGGNSVIGIDPNTGTTVRTIPAGTNPNKLALSSDGTQLFVGIDGAASVAQIDLKKGTIVNQFSLGGGNGYYNAPSTALYLAAVPGQPNSVAVSSNGQSGYGGTVTIFDSGVARTGSTVTNIGEGPLSFGASASTLYVASNYLDALTVGPGGITASMQLFSPTYNLTWIQYDNGSLYLSDGQVVSAATGALNGTLYTSGTTVATGPIVSDSTLGKAFVWSNSFNGPNAVDVFDELTFNLLGTIPLNNPAYGYTGNFNKIVRWGQNGIALAAGGNYSAPNSQIYIVQSSLVKDVSSSPADLAASLTAPATAATGTAVSYTVNVLNNGPNAAVGATLAVGLDASLIVNSVTSTQGTCTTAITFACDLGALANGATATVTVSATPTTAGTLASTAAVSSSSFDPTSTNNQASGSTAVTGSVYSGSASISSLSPNLVQAGSAAFTLTVNGSGFNSASSVNLGGTALVTTLVSPTQVTAAVTATAIANYGWAPVTVTNASPGGGTSAVTPLTIYDLVNVSPNSIVFDPWGQSVYATVPSTSTSTTGNSIVAVNPSTGTLGTAVAVGSQPSLMAETSDGNFLYVSLTGANSLVKFDLRSQSIAAIIPLTYQSASSSASSLAAMPGTDNTLAVGISNGYSFGILDINGTTGSFRPNTSGTYTGINPVFANSTELYAYDSQTSYAEFYRYSVDANGVKLLDGTTLDGLGGFNGGFLSTNNLIYGEAGGLINPTTTPPTQIQTLPLLGQSAAVIADPSLQKEFILEGNVTNFSPYALVRYDLKSYLPETFLSLPSTDQGYGEQWTMQRFGQDGIALLSSDNYSQPSPVVQLILLRGPFVTPQELSTSTAATLSSAPAITHGSGNTTLTLTGSNFLPGVAVTWNGSYRTTTVVDASHAAVLIPASDLTSAGSASVVATNPGAPASTALSITIN